MTFRASLLYALRLLHSPRRSNGRRSLLGAMFCIGISLVPLIAVLVVSDGMISGIIGRIIGLSTDDISVYVRSSASETQDKEAFCAYTEYLRKVEGVTDGYPEVAGTALAAAHNYRTGASVRAVPDDIFSVNEAFSSLFEFIEGTGSLSEERTAVIGQKLAQDLRLHVGDRLTLVTSAKMTNAAIVPKTAVFTVGGIVSCGYQELDALWVFIPLQAGFSFLPRASSQFIVKLATGNSFSPDLMQISWRVQLRSGPASVYTWNELNAAQYENFSSTKVLLLLIMLLIVLVASVNISSALVMIVLERRKEIAILKSLGATQSGVTVAFLLVGAAAGAGGVFCGLPLGLLAAVNINQLLAFFEKMLNVLSKFVYLLGHEDASLYSSIHLLDPAYYLQHIPITIPFAELFIIVLGTLLLSLLASSFPAVKAGKEKPLDTLRKV